MKPEELEGRERSLPLPACGSCGGASLTGLGSFPRPRPEETATPTAHRAERRGRRAGAAGLLPGRGSSTRGGVPRPFTDLPRPHARPDLEDGAAGPLRLSSGRGQAAYGEGAWPGDILYAFAPAIFAQLALAAGPALAAAPPFPRVAANPFRTPAALLPEWYLSPTFSALRVRPAKAAGVGAGAALLGALPAAPPADAALLGAAQSPFRRAAGAGPALAVVPAGLAASLGALLPLPAAGPGW